MSAGRGRETSPSCGFVATEGAFDRRNRRLFKFNNFGDRRHGDLPSR